MNKIHNVDINTLDKQIELATDIDNKDVCDIHDIYYCNELNFLVGCHYYVKDGIYKFLDKQTHIEYMFKYGITCGCERRLIDGRIKFFYNNVEMTEQQYKFLRNRTIQLKYTIKGQPNKKGCGCVKKG